MFLGAWIQDEGEAIEDAVDPSLLTKQRFVSYGAQVESPRRSMDGLD